MKLKFAPIALGATLALAVAGVSSLVTASPASAAPGAFNNGAPYQIAQGPLWQPWHGEWRKMTEHGWEYRTDAPDYRPGARAALRSGYGGYSGYGGRYNGYNNYAYRHNGFNGYHPNFYHGGNGYGYHHGFNNAAVSPHRFGGFNHYHH